MGNWPIICEPANECHDQHLYRWYCMRGHELDGQPAEKGVCHLTKCVAAAMRATS